jgi:asparagine synthase (glutamine-hydrolysing)
MCGIAGFVEAPGTRSSQAMNDVVSRMTDALHHRGPDDRGIYVDGESGAALGHRRLSIVDLSDAGRQPMRSRDGRYVLSFNGEIYNHVALRRELRDRGTTFRGTSDTEVLLEACSAWSPRQALERSHGMFAIALWDCQELALLLARDRLGIKPLYWAQHGAGLIFASELKALRCHPAWQGRLSQAAVAEFLRHGFVPGPQTIHQQVQKLLGGEMLVWSAADPTARLERFWDLRKLASERTSRAPLSQQEALEQLHALLLEAVSSHMVADVPLGALLSGGIDSSTVVALMQAQSTRPVRTFSIGFEKTEYDEAPYARAVARHLGTDHTELYVSGAHASDLIPRLPEWYDEPFADSSQIPTYLVCEMARQHVTVALTGDGGDELFCGYPRYGRTELLWRRLSTVPAPVRVAVGRALSKLPVAALERVLRAAPAHIRRRLSAQRLQHIGVALPAVSPDEFYDKSLFIWSNPAELLLHRSEEPCPAGPAAARWKGPDDLVSRLQLRDILSYLPDDLLTKVDRASMAVGLEARIPLLDHRVVEFTGQLSPRLHRADGHGKFALRQVLARYVPSKLVDRPKQGFAVPLGPWLRGPLRPWAEALLSKEALRRHDVLNVDRVRQAWLGYLAGTRDGDARLWLVLMLQAWLARWQS